MKLGNPGWLLGQARTAHHPQAWEKQPLRLKEYAQNPPPLTKTLGNKPRGRASIPVLEAVPSDGLTLCEVLLPLYWLPIATIANCSKFSGLKTYKFMLLQLHSTSNLRVSHEESSLSPLLSSFFLHSLFSQCHPRRWLWVCWSMCGHLCVICTHTSVYV